MAISPSKLVILDRDGVINQDSDDYIKSPDEWISYPASIEAMATLCNAGFTLAIATNQSGVARGYYDEATLAAIHRKMIAEVEAAGGQIAHISYCPHGPGDQCDCRKPLPGLLYQIQRQLGLATLAGSWMVGDSLRDLQAGHAAGSHTALVTTGKGEKTLVDIAALGNEAWANVAVYQDLAGFARWLCAESCATH